MSIGCTTEPPISALANKIIEDIDSRDDWTYKYDNYGGKLYSNMYMPYTLQLSTGQSTYKVSVKLVGYIGDAFTTHEQNLIESALNRAISRSDEIARKLYEERAKKENAELLARLFPKLTSPLGPTELGKVEHNSETDRNLIVD